jgi:hypothetical protein
LRSYRKDILCHNFEPAGHQDSTEEWEDPETILKDDPDLKHKAKGKVGNFFFFCLCVNLLAVLPRNF